METRVALGCIGDRRRGGVGILAPADVALGQAIEALDAPLDADIGRGTFTARASPCVIDGDGAEAAGILENVTGDTVAVWKLGTWIGANGAVDALWITKPVAEGVHVVNGHDA